jgi:5-methylthioadenosine/S-adenosylhomocysteine deaminase
MKNDTRVSRRDALKAGATIAASAAAAGGLTSEAQAQAQANAQDVRRFDQQPPVDAKHRILLKGGTIISMDDKVGDLAKGDVLIEGSKISAIAPELTAAGAQVIDASNSIVIPGLVDCHRHSWEAQLRRINPNSPTLADYSNATHLSFAKFYRPQDHYVGNYLTAIGCIDYGITCVIDNSHNSRSAAHSDAAVEALMDGGVRAVHASGPPGAGDWAHQWPADLERLQKKYFSSTDQLVTLRMFSGPSRENWEVARRLGLRITTEFQGPQQAALLDPLAADKLVRSDNTFNHCGALPEQTWQIIVDSGANVNVCPRSDAQYALGEGVCALQHAWNHGIKPGFSVDNETSYSGDMFMEMRVALYLQRAIAKNRAFLGDQNPPKPLMIRDVFHCATLGGAHCAGLDDKIGSLTPGKQADVVVIRTDDPNIYPPNNALGVVVQAADRGNIDTVIIGGRVRKYRGKVVGLDMGKLKGMIDESRAHLFTSAGYKPDIFAELLPKLS